MRRLLPFLALSLAACDGGNRCPAGAGQPVRVYDLYFGRSAPGRGEITEHEWREFRDAVVTPALPHGYTVLDGQGAWLNPRRRATISESTKILVVALPDAPESQTTINRLRAAWQRRFHQYLVGMTVRAGCGSFNPAELP